MTLPNNTLLQGGKYRIVRFISSGGFGCTYEAEHVMLGKRVAIKEFFVKDFCNRDETTSHVTVGTQTKVALVSKLKRKFIEEASALGRFNHPNIVHVSDVFEENGTAYYVMDFIDGKSINEILKTQSTIPESKAVKYILQVAEALKQVHAQNRLHLDIKPGNIMIDSHDNAVLIDFGASKQYDEEAGENTSTLVGRTPGYAPLEQLGNDVVKFKPATDIYALGATLYKMLSGKTPLSATLLASGESLEPLPNNITKTTRDAVNKCMAINKNNRPQSVEDFLSLFSSKAKTTNSYQIETETEDTEIDVSTDAKPHQSSPSKSIPEYNDVSETNYEPEAKSKKSLLIVAAIAIIAIVFGFVVFNSDSTQPENIVESVVAKEFTNSNNKTFKFTGEVIGNNLPNGEGVGLYEQGTYTGEYVNGIRQGRGEFRTKDGQNIFNGTFDNDLYSNGRLTFSDGSYFEGSFNSDKPYNGYLYEKNKKVGQYINGEYKWL